MKKLFKSLIVAMFALPIVGCGEEGGGGVTPGPDPVPPVTDWSKYVDVKGGDVVVGNEGTIELVNDATEALPEGYEIVALNAPKAITRAGDYEINYGISDPEGTIVYEFSVDYSVELDYKGIGFETSFQVRDPENGKVAADIEVPGYLWNAGHTAYVTLKFGNSYSTYGIDFDEIFSKACDMFSWIFSCEESEEATANELKRSFSNEYTLEDFIYKLSPLVEWFVSTFEEYADDLYTVTDDLENKTIEIEIHFHTIAEMLDELVEPFIKEEWFDCEQYESIRDFIDNAEFVLTLSGYSVEGEALVGAPTGLDAEGSVLASTFLPLIDDIYLDFSIVGSFEIQSEDYSVINLSLDTQLRQKVEEGDDVIIPFLKYTLNGDVSTNEGRKDLHLTLSLVNNQPTEVGIFDFVYEFDLDAEVPFVFHSLQFDYRSYATSYQLVVDIDTLFVRYAKAVHEGECDFFNPEVDTLETCVALERLDISVLGDTPHIAYQEIDDTHTFIFYLSLTGLAVKYYDKVSKDNYLFSAVFETKVCVFSADLGYFEIGEGEQKEEFYTYEINVRLEYVDLPDEVVKSSENSKGIDDIVDTVSTLLALAL